MENQTVVMEDGGTKTREQKNKLGIVGFIICMIYSQAGLPWM